MGSCLGATAKEALENLFSYLETEYEEIDSFLDPGEAEVYRQYYRDMPIRHLSSEQRLRRYRRFCRGYLHYIVAELLKWKGEPPVVLDAGSGLGTQAMLFGLLGAAVHAVDLRHDRVVIAQKRWQYWEKKLGTKLNIEFECLSVFLMDQKEAYDYIWVCQAISHIDPAEGFLDLSYRLLKPGGQIVLYDPNGLFIPNQIQQLRHRGLKIHQTFQTHAGETVPYAVERLFSYGGIKRLLCRRGFDIAHGECQFSKFRGKTSDETFERFFSLLDTMPVFSNLFGHSYIVAGRRPHSGG